MEYWKFPFTVGSQIYGATMTCVRPSYCSSREVGRSVAVETGVASFQNSTCPLAAGRPLAPFASGNDAVDAELSAEGVAYLAPAPELRFIVIYTID
jgi:hypothetical protein